MVTAALTRKGISESCALHLPNVSRAMKSLHKKGHLEEHTRAIIGEERRQKTWQLSPSGLDIAEEIQAKAKQMEVLIRDESGTHARGKGRPSIQSPECRFVPSRCLDACST